MSRILFVSQAQTGHINTLLSMALELKKEHETRFLFPGIKSSSENQKIPKELKVAPNLLNANQLPFDIIPLPLSVALKGSVLPKTTGYLETTVAVEIFMDALEYYTREILQQLATFKPDVIVADFAFLGAVLAAELSDTPCVVVYHSGLPFPGKDIPPFGSGLPIGATDRSGWEKYERLDRISTGRLKKQFNRVRQKLGLPPNDQDPLHHPSSKWLNLITSHEAIEAPRDNLGANTLFIGPCFGNRKQAKNDFPFDKLRSDKFKVYVSLGTVFNKKPKVFETIINALDKPEFQLIVSAGMSYKILSERVKSENVLLFPSVPQVDLLPLVDMVIGHGGNNSTNETLSAGKPLLVIPIGGEQHDNASRVEYLKAGLKLDIKTLSEAEVYQKVCQIKANPSFQTRAQELKQAIATTDGVISATRCIEWLITHKKPFSRPVDLPLTVTRDTLEVLLANQT